MTGTKIIIPSEKNLNGIKFPHFTESDKMLVPDSDKCPEQTLTNYAEIQRNAL